MRRDTNRSKNRSDNGKIINKTLQKSIIKIRKFSILKGGEGSRGIYLMAPESGWKKSSIAKASKTGSPTKRITWLGFGQIIQIVLVVRQRF